jgi:glycosyltransferase involved in cell wall biosynthesis
MISVIYDYQIFGFQLYGGVSRYFYELARRVAKANGFSAAVVAPLYVNRYLNEEGVHIKGMRIPAVPIAGGIVSIFNRCATSIMLRVLRPNLVHETYYKKTSCAPKGCPVVITVYDMIHERFKNNFGALDETSSRKRAAVKRADRVICISERTRIDLIELLDLDPRKAKTIHLGFSLTKQIGPANYPTQRKPFFLYVGQRSGHKNFANLANAYASSTLLRHHFDLVAYGGKEFTRGEIESFSALGLNSVQIRQLSGDDAMLADLYSRAAAFVYPSLYEGFGIPPLEAMSFDCPVLCASAGSIPEIVGDAGLYFDPSQPDAIRHAMELLVSSAELRSDLVARGKARVKNFSYDRCATETLDVYRDLLQ